MTDPLLRALEDANPVSEADFRALPPLGPLPAPRRRRAPAVALVVALALAVIGGVALLPSSTPGGGEVLARALAGGSDGAVLYWRVRTERPGLVSFTDDVWMHVRGDGAIVRVRELRLDGQYAGMESVISQPFGVGDLRGAVTRTRSSADGPIRVGEGVGLPDLSFSDMVSTAERAARGSLDVGEARAVAFDGRDAYEIVLREASGTGATPPELAVRMWVERESGRPLAVRWGEGATLWRTARLLDFERFPDNARSRALLEFPAT